MKPYYNDNAVTIYHGDALQCFECVASVDSVITDPPYCSGAFSETARKASKSQGLSDEGLAKIGWFTGDNMGTAGIVWLLRNLAVRSFPIIADGGHFCCFTDWRMTANIAPAIESSGLRWQNLLVWNKKYAGMGQGFRAQHELILHFVKGTARFHSAMHGNVLDVPRMDHRQREHPTQKPIQLMQCLIETTTPSGGVVLDPFAGSGTTLAAAKLLGRRAIGFERDERFCEIAAKRISHDAVPLV